MWIQLAEARKKAFKITNAYLITKLRLAYLKRCLIVIFSTTMKWERDHTRELKCNNKDLSPLR